MAMTLRTSLRVPTRPAADALDWGLHPERKAGLFLKTWLLAAARRDGVRARLLRLRSRQRRKGYGRTSALELTGRRLKCPSPPLRSACFLKIPSAPVGADGAVGNTQLATHRWVQ